jgi:hypothetical protein
MALTGHIKSDENSAAVSNVCLILGYFHMSNLSYNKLYV